MQSINLHLKSHLKLAALLARSNFQSINIEDLPSYQNFKSIINVGTYNIHILNIYISLPYV